MAIDTLDYVKRLEAAGISRTQAEAHAEAVKSAVIPDLATRQDVQNVKQELESRIVLIQWMLGFNLAATMAVLWRLLR